jgi:DnaK suppressor protein
MLLQFVFANLTLAKWATLHSSHGFRTQRSGKMRQTVKGGDMLSGRKIEEFKTLLESRVTESQRVLASAEQEVRESSARHADSADQAAAEYERQTLAHKADLARQTIRTLTDAVRRIRQGTFGECAQCGAEIETKRLEVIPWAGYCVRCQDAREQR